MRIIIAGNWKMHKTVLKTQAYLDAFLPIVATHDPGAVIILAPPFTALQAAGERLRGTHIRLCAQTMHWEDRGAFTGEIAPPMLLELGVSYVIVGHSERRRYFNETDETVRLRTQAALAHGMTPIVAVGETHEERQAGKTDERVTQQTNDALRGLDAGAIAKVVLAYEPVWAIGTGQNCEPHEADRVMGIIRSCNAALGAVPIIYGGSVTADNIGTYMRLPNINGGLVGGASLDPAGFAQLVANAVAANA
jgi:triosephosphate isomerase (TIM)